MLALDSIIQVGRGREVKPPNRKHNKPVYAVRKPYHPVRLSFPHETAP